jgi:hypothetical protein
VVGDGVPSTAVSAAVAGVVVAADSSDPESHAVAANSSTVAPMAPRVARRRFVVTRITLVTRWRRCAAAVTVFPKPSGLPVPVLRAVI